MKKDIPIIKCPHCGQEYLPSEIFMPDSFFGKQKEISKTPGGEIDFYIGEDMDLDEEFVCESCGKKMRIHANLSFDVELGEEDFEEEYSTTINRQKIKLEEEELFN